MQPSQLDTTIAHHVKLVNGYGYYARTTRRRITVAEDTPAKLFHEMDERDRGRIRQIGIQTHSHSSQEDGEVPVSSLVSSDSCAASRASTYMFLAKLATVVGERKARYNTGRHNLRNSI
jgi:hypothetical protein